MSQALDKIKDTIEELTDPDVMDEHEYKEFLQELLEEIQGRLEEVD